MPCSSDLERGGFRCFSSLTLNRLISLHWCFLFTRCGAMWLEDKRWNFNICLFECVEFNHIAQAAIGWSPLLYLTTAATFSGSGENPQASKTHVWTWFYLSRWKERNITQCSSAQMYWLSLLPWSVSWKNTENMKKQIMVQLFILVFTADYQTLGTTKEWNSPA